MKGETRPMTDPDVVKIAGELPLIAREGLEYHARPDRRSSCGNMGTDMALMFAGLVTFAPDSRLMLTPLGEQVRAYLIGDEK